jgi:hypothetical protein
MEEKSIVIRPDFHCELYIDNVYQTLAKGRVDLKITGFSDGKHYLKCICTICDIVIEREINIPDDSRLEISFEDFLLQHPDCIKYQLDFAVFLEWFPKLADKWKGLDIIPGEPLWANECELDIPISVTRGNREGYVDILGNEALDYYYIIREGDKYGYANGLNNIIKPCVYDKVTLFDYQQMDRVLDHLGMTEKCNECKMSQADWDKFKEFIEDHGDEYPFVLNHNTGIDEPYSDGCALLFLCGKLVNTSQKWGIINLKKNIETPIKYNHVHTGGLYTYFGRIAVDIDGKWGLFDFEKFTQIVDCQYDFIDIRKDKYIRYYQNGLCGLMDSDGNKLTEAIYLQIKQFSDGLFRVKRDDKWGFVDENGQECIACIFDKVDDFCGGVAKYYEGGLFGFINHKGDRLTDPIYICSEILPNGQIKIKTEFNWGVINQEGIECLPMEYDEVLSFNDIVIGVKKDDGKISLSSTGAVFNCDDYSLLDAGHICIYSNDKWKLFYTSGKAVFADSFDEIGTLVKGKMLFLRIGRRYALYNLSEHKYITSFIYDDMFICDNGRIALNRNGLWGFLDKNGEELIPCEFKKLDNWFGHISYFRGINIQWDKYGNGVWLDTEPKTIKLRKK